MALRLAEAGRSVLVIEHGGIGRRAVHPHAGALSYPMNMARYDWGYRSEPEPHLGGRRLACPRGKVIGGSSSINGMVYVRGHARDFDHWARRGARGWAMPTFCPISSAWSAGMTAATAATRPGAAPRGRCMSAAGGATTR